ncbi:hypothetical protein [Agrobacterium sp. lyk4-40-TYG-31]|uniref:hypothetical protein n=1 Tax=Agrobacterium sp. lyk4-40-TYG-31 TaxID=3040276 RepID=UPI002551B42C|nr:hypothetical protein [Agrobacterium sp. lyk4-40-TYG-31]
MNFPNITQYILKEFPDWLPKYSEAPVEMIYKNLEDWLQGDDSRSKSIGRYLGQINLLELKAFVLSAVQGTADTERLAKAARLSFAPLPYAIGIQHLNTNSALSFPDFVNGLAQVMTVGWKERSELLGRLALRELEKDSILRGKFYGGALGQGVTSFGFPYAFMDIVADWLNVDETSTQTEWREKVYEEYAGGYGGWAELVAQWREPDVVVFHRILVKAADYHVAQSHDMETKGDKRSRTEKHYEIEPDAYWAFPVLLLMVLRMREWVGLENPGYLNHDLFQMGVFKELPKPLPWPDDPLLDAVDEKYRQLFPETPSTADIAKLRADQS